MMYLHSFRNPLPLVITCLISIEMIIGGTPLTASSSVSASATFLQKDFPVKTMAPDFQVEEFEQDGPKIRLVMSNNYAKNITAFALTATKPDRADYVLTHSMDLIVSDKEDARVIRPGAKFVFEGDIGSPVEQHDLTIRAVVFDDLSSAGDAVYVKQVLDKRQGRQLLIDAVLPQFQRLARAAAQLGALNSEVFANQLNEAKKLATSLSSNRPMWGTPDMQFGYKTQAEDLRLRLEEVERDFQSGNFQSVKFKLARHEKRLESLKNRLQVP